MKQFSVQCLIFIFTFLSLSNISAQKVSLTKEYKKDAIDKLSMLMNDFYIYPEVAEKTSAHLEAQFEAGYFDSFEDDETFAQALTEAVQFINKDKHMRVRARPPYEAPVNSIERKTAERMDQINNYRSFNHGFTELKILEGNVAYLDLRGFAGMERAKEIADAYMKLMSQADAVIIDLSKNGGGSPNMVQYLCSYFFDEVLHLNSLHYRQDNRVDEFWTLEEVGGKKMANIPLFVITGEGTFSGAEEFSYNMQTQKRATLIGQTSGGGANPGGTRGINEQLSVFIPTGRAVNPITKTSWEGTGVIPEVSTSVEETFATAHELAKEAAKEHREAKSNKYKEMYLSMETHLGEYVKGESEIAIEQSISDFVVTGLFGEWDINALGYEYLLQKQQEEIALCIFKTNTVIFPESANVFDSYGEALMNAGDLKGSIASYQQAVEIATKNEDRDLGFYKDNLQKVKDMMGEGK